MRLTKPNTISKKLYESLKTCALYKLGYSTFYIWRQFAHAGVASSEGFRVETRDLSCYGLRATALTSHGKISRLWSDARDFLIRVSISVT